ncbi:hypothetical protein MACH09_04970 [Vibrio sp. MACH09]|nr:hypothetical protein MACH09_04970 [Vibrio sp. MACH09]
MIRKLMNGEFGLPITFWVFYFLAVIPINATLEYSESMPLSVGLLLLEVLLEILVIRGIWTLRTSYNGWRIWIWLALTMVSISLIIGISALVMSFYYSVHG